MDPYFVGLIAADGHNAGKYWIFGQVEDNAGLVYCIRSYFTDASLGFQKPKIKDGAYSEKTRFTVRRNSGDDCRQLILWGVPVGNKTYSLRFPSVNEFENEELWRYMIGFWEGDGSVYMEKDRYSRISIISNDFWCKEASKWLGKQGIHSVVFKDKRHDGISNLYIKRKKSFDAFVDKINKAKDVCQSSTKMISLCRILLYLEGVEIQDRKTTTEKERERFKKQAKILLKEGLSAKDISQKIGCCINLVIKQKRAIGMSRRDISKEKMKQIESLFENGLSRSEIQRMNYGYKLIKKVANRLFGDSKERKKKKREQVESLIIKGWRNKDICEETQCSQAYLIKLKKEMKKQGLNVKMNKRRNKDDKVE